MTAKSAKARGIYRDYFIADGERALDKIKRWREAAVADGWSLTATYGDEPATSAGSLEREGFEASILARDLRVNPSWGVPRIEVNVHVWGPDGLAIDPPEVYDWEAIKAGVRTCGECKRRDVETQRVAFANRACAACAPDLRRKLETPGWCD